MSEDEAVLNKQEYEEINKRQGKRLLTLELRLMQEREAHANTRQIREVLERELYQLQEAVEAEQTAHAETRRRLEEIERCIPETFYAGIPLPKRVEFLRQQWRRLHEVNQDLERRLADSESIRSAEKEILIKEIADHAETRRQTLAVVQAWWVKYDLLERRLADATNAAVKDVTDSLTAVLGSADMSDVKGYLRRRYPSAFPESAAPSSKPSEVLGWLGTENGYTQDTRSAAPVVERAKAENPPCGRCGGIHPFDTVIPNDLWNSVVRAHGVSEYLCLSCIVEVFNLHGMGFTAELWGGSFHGLPIEVRIGAPAEGGTE
jgi:hypothetical protein